MLHGECISIGMILEAEIARFTNGLSQVAIGRLTRCLKEYNLPVTMADPRVSRLSRSSGLTVDRLLDIMRVDKKNSGDEKKIVLLARIGATVEEKASTVADAIIRRVLSLAARVVPTSAIKPFTLSTPGSKSISNRALILASLAKGTCRLRNLLHSDDTQVMMAGLHDLEAAQFSWEDGGDTIVVEGHQGKLKAPTGKEIYLQNAGTAARFMTTVCALVGGANPVTITGNKRMKERPIGALVDALVANGTAISYKEATGCLPLSILGPTGGLAGGRIELAATISSQYVSSILLCAPYAQDDVILDLVGGAVISQPYIDMTIAMMKSFGVEVQRLVDAKTGTPLNTYRVPRGHYVSPATYDIESDASSATYPLAIAAITGTECTVPNIGSASLQGDARFAKDVLEPMGCQVTQTATSTTVKGPPLGQLRQIGTVDMEPMTDAFLTASVLFAVATKGDLPSTRIAGIANQRVKECNRIAAMIDELAKFGVRTVEHPDGLEVFGVPHEKLNENVSVHCYDDHRVAMAFSVLALVTPGPGTVLEEKRCVEKTWPNWWDDLERVVGVRVQGADAPAPSASSSVASTSSLSNISKSLTPVQYQPDATIFCIGMRASGKTYLGGFGAAALNRPFIDADVLFNERYNLNSFVKEHGWPAFRKAETDILRELMTERATGHLISLGGGVIEMEENRRLLMEYAKTKGPVVYVLRDIEEVVSFLETSDRPAYGEPVRDVFRRRQPWFSECSSYELVSYSGDADVVDAFDAEIASLPPPSTPVDGTRTMGPPSKAASIRKAVGLEAEVARFFRFIAGEEANQVDDVETRSTYFLSLTFPDLRPALSIIEKITAGADAIERTWLPIVYVVRTVSQGGMFPDEEEDTYFELLKLGLRHGCEYVDLELRWPEARLDAVRAHRGHSKIIASWHDWSGQMKWEDASTLSKFEQACKYGDVAKIVNRATSFADNLSLEAFRARVSSLPVAKPLLAINMGEVGQMSRTLNPVLSPITNEDMPFKAAPGQLTFSQIQKTLHLIGQLPAKRFTLLGTPISHSLSPCLHNTAFEVLGLPHQYGLLETAEADDTAVVAFLRSADFGGASVTMPHKLSIIKLLDVITPEAQAIGAINTISPVVRQDGRKVLEGDNTDWIAIAECSRRNLSPIQLSSSDFTALVIGAGGSARAALYAMSRLGAKTIMLFNRTKANADLLASQVPREWNVVVVSSLNDLPHRPVAIVSNVPSDGTSLDPSSGKGIILPRSILSNEKGGVVIDMSYKPMNTPLIQLVRETNATFAQSTASADRRNLREGRLWTGITGVTIVLEQGCHQFRKWTGREAPRAPIEIAAWQKYFSQ
ncbi:hypothetical protein L7F22_061663 [Adiantum nelumboides]|nr:hypothetical protein [Adiantum nelumboides]